MQSSASKPASSIDDFSPSLAANAGRSRSAGSGDTIDAVDVTKGGSIAEETEQYTREPAEIADQLDAERDLEHDKNIDEFSPFNPQKDKEKGKRDERRKRRQRRIGKLRRINDDVEEDEVFDFLGYLESLWRKLTDMVEQVVDEFDNWNNWFKKEKKKPPAPDPSRVTYIRDEFLANRSPHLWKSNPDRKWVLTFGNNTVNNVVSSILYKYQNETISKDA